MPKLVECTRLDSSDMIKDWAKTYEYSEGSIRVTVTETEKCIAQEVIVEVDYDDKRIRLNSSEIQTVRKILDEMERDGVLS